MNKKRKPINSSLLVMLSFVLLIIIGSIFICSPLGQANGQWGNYMDAFFTAVSATCVTGLSTYADGIANSLSLFGQIVVLVLIQIGGLGFITILAFLVTMFRGKITFKNRFVLSQMVNSVNITNVVKFVRRVILISLTIEIIGILLGLPVFFEAFGTDDVGKVIWVSTFTSISSFNNAGFDIFGSTSLIRGVGNTFIDGLPTWAYYYLCSYIMILIVMGGIGFMVIMEVFSFKRKPKQWSVSTKIVLTTTGILLFFGFVVFLLADYVPGNGMSPFDALFQSVTTRTAGYSTVSQDNLSLISKVTSCILMFIGGSPIGTAGGIKTTTAFVIVLAIISYFSGREPAAFNRKYTNKLFVKAITLIFASLFLLLVSWVVLNTVEGGLDLNAIGIKTDKTSAIAYEIFSAFGTVGVSVGITPYLSIASKIIICILMFVGRLGPFLFFQLVGAMMEKQRQNHFQYIEDDFLIG